MSSREVLYLLTAFLAGGLSVSGVLSLLVWMAVRVQKYTDKKRDGQE